MKNILLCLFAGLSISARGQAVVGQAVTNASRAIQSRYPSSARKNIILFTGDSLLNNFSLDVPLHKAPPAVCAKILQQAGYPVVGVNVAASGSTSTDVLNKCRQFNQFGTPKVFFIYIGANDTSGGLSTNLTTTNIVCSIQAARFGAIGSAATEAALPANQRVGTRYVVLADAGSNGGAAAFVGYTATVTGAGSGAIGNIWECRNPNSSTNGWGRVFTVASTPTHCTNCVVVGMGYQNFTSGGDSGATPSSYAGIREAQQTAVTYVNNANVVYYNLYADMYALITSGQETQASGSWHRNGTNQHYNEIGWGYLGQFFAALIYSKSAWLAAIN